MKHIKRLKFSLLCQGFVAVERSFMSALTVITIWLTVTTAAHGQTCGQGSSQITVGGNTVSPFQEVCQNAVITYGHSGAPLSSPSWSTIPSGAGIFTDGITSGSSVTVTWISSGKLRMDYPDMNGDQCGEITYTITSYNPGVVNGPSVVCYDATFNITLSGSQNAGSAVWQKCTANCSNDANWTNIAGVTGSPLQITNFTQTTSFRTKLTYSACDGSGQVTSYSPVRSVSVNTASPMVVNITDPGSICNGQLSSLTISVMGTSVLGQNPSYEWYRNGSLADHNSSTDPQVFDPASPNYDFQIGDQLQLKITSGPGCVAWSNLVVIATTQETFPSLGSIARSPAGICAGQQVTFTINTGGANITGNWHIGSGGFPFNGSAYTVNADDISGLQVHFSTQLTGSCGTTQQASTHTAAITLDPSPLVIASDAEICAGQTVSIGLSSDLPGSTFTWTAAHNNTTSGASSGSGNTISQTIGLTSAADGVATYTVVGTSLLGCVGQAVDVHAYVFAIPANPSMSTTEICDFERVKFSADLTAGISDYKWFNAQDVLIGQGPKLTLDVFPSGSYTFKVQAISSKGCIGNSPSPFTISVVNSCENLNWIETTGYSVSGTAPYAQQMIAQAKSYFDLSGAPLQSQARNLTRNKILTSVAVTDKFGRVAATSLPAPTNLTAFQYKHWFARTNTGELLDHSNLGSPLGDQTGTVGRYYSSSNDDEQYVPVTGYPLSEVEYYEDGTGEVKKAGGVGDVLRLGMGHEVLTANFPVYHELDDYLARRSDAIPGIGQDGSLFNEGLQSVVRDQNEEYSISITDKSGKGVMSARKGTTEEHDLAISNTITSAFDPASADHRPLTYFYILEDQAVSISGTAEYVIEDIVAGTTYTPDGGMWSAGFYRIVLQSGSITVGYTNYFRDVSCQFYNDAGRIVSSVSPNGFRQLKQGVAYANIDKTTYQYNHRGWLLSLTEPDAGETKYVYRKDGKIRFSQNALQSSNNRFSYTHYDRLGRPVESGEYIGSTVTFVPMNVVSFAESAMKGELEKVYEDINWAEVDKNDWVITYYDATPPGSIPLSLQQEFIRGAVSSSKNKHNQTWYSYDELGRVTWMAQQPNDLPVTPVLRYTYDFPGNVLQVENATYQSGTLVSQFFHHYEYDADLRLSRAYTSTDGSTKTLRATYEYYLHGPLKRIELGDKLQGIDFVYNINGWLTQINHPDTDLDPGKDGLTGEHAAVRKDVFGMVLDYYESSMNNLYSASTGPAIQNLNLIHGLPDQSQRVASHQPLIRFNTVADPSQGISHPGTFKTFSAEHTRYREVLFRDQK